MNNGTTTTNTKAPAPRVFREDDMHRDVVARAATKNAQGEETSSVDLAALMLDALWIDNAGNRWEVGKPSPPSDGRNTVLYLFFDERETRIYCAPSKEHPGPFVRYVVGRAVPARGEPELRVQKTGN